MLNNYVNAMEYWKGRVDSTDDYDTFRWHQWVKPIDLNEYDKKFEGPLGFAFTANRVLKETRAVQVQRWHLTLSGGRCQICPAVFHRK